jgi:hypothetical protein
MMLDSQIFSDPVEIAEDSPARFFLKPNFSGRTPLPIEKPSALHKIPTLLSSKPLSHTVPHRPAK